MFGLKKCITVLSVSFLFGCATLPGSSDADKKVADARELLKQAAVSFEKTLPVLVSSEDYWSASNVAFLLANARNRLEQTPAACKALAQSLVYYHLAIVKETGVTDTDMRSDLSDDSSGMADIRARFGCGRARAGLPA